MVRIDPAARTYTCFAYKFDVDAARDEKSSQYAGWPLTIKQEENYGRKRVGKLQQCAAPEGVENPVVMVMTEPTGELVYALRVRAKTFEPFVFEPGTYTVKIGEPETDRWRVITGQRISGG